MERWNDAPMSDVEYQNRDARLPSDTAFRGGTQTLRGKAFGDPSKPFTSSRTGLPQTPIRSHLANFRENPILDFSSGTEAASSPDNADDEDTPDPQPRRKAGTGAASELGPNVTVFRGNTHSPSKVEAPTMLEPATPTISSRSWTAAFQPRFGMASSHHKSNAHASALVRRHGHGQSLMRRDQRPSKRKRRDLDHDAMDLDTDDMSRPGSSDSQSENPATPRSPKQMSTISAVLAFIHSHPHLPHILAYYGQLVLNWAIVAGLLTLGWNFWRTIRQDVDLRADAAAQDVLAEMATCAEKFVGHGCPERQRLGPEFRPMCDAWKTCMERDARAVGRARISAHTFAEIIDGFVDPLSYKMLFFGLALIFVVSVLPHALFGALRRQGPNNFASTPTSSGPGSANPIASAPAFSQVTGFHSPVKGFHSPVRHDEGFTTPLPGGSWDETWATPRTRRSPRKPSAESPTRRIGFR